MIHSKMCGYNEKKNEALFVDSSKNFHFVYEIRIWGFDEWNRLRIRIFFSSLLWLFIKIKLFYIECKVDEKATGDPSFLVWGL